MNRPTSFTPGKLTEQDEKADRQNETQESGKERGGMGVVGHKPLAQYRKHQRRHHRDPSPRFRRNDSADAQSRLRRRQVPHQFDGELKSI